MEVTGKRHPFFARGDVGFDDDGRITALRAELFADGGFALDLSESIHDRALFHIDNCYDVANIEVSGRVCKTNVVSHTAFRGFGGPQGMLVMEDVLTRIAQHTGRSADDVRARNFYREKAPFGLTPYHQEVDDFRVARLWPALLASAEVKARRQAIAAWNATSAHVKRGLAVTPVKFGISFTASFLNQAGALVVIYRDGSLQVNHGGTEMGQGLYTKILGITQRELGLSEPGCVRVMQTRTDKVPNTSATAASSGADLNGAAVVAALQELKARLRPVARDLLENRGGRPVKAEDVVFVDGHVRIGGAGGDGGVGIAFADLAEAAYVRQVSLSATGFYKTPNIFYDKKSGRGRPFHYFAYGVCAAEVEVDGTTGMKKVRRVDVLHDAGDSLHPSVDRGQVEGALVQGIGWLTGEQLLWTPDGRLLSHSASTYQIPSFSDAPAVFKVSLLDDETAPQKDVVHGSKAVGEPPFMLALAVREALKEAVAAFATGGHVVAVPSPLTHEALFHAVQAARRA
jgi:xanthine dehydrogenase molybdopterin-binding subunit B